jgi:hypothetical protein
VSTAVSSSAPGPSAPPVLSPGLALALAIGFGILGGFATLIWRMREPGDDGGDGDDGAVV